MGQPFPDCGGVDAVRQAHVLNDCADYAPRADTVANQRELVEEATQLVPADAVDAQFCVALIRAVCGAESASRSGIREP